MSTNYLAQQVVSKPPAKLPEPRNPRLLPPRHVPRNRTLGSYAEEHALGREKGILEFPYLSDGFNHSTQARTSPAFTLCPSFASRRSTFPFFGDLISFLHLHRCRLRAVPCGFPRCPHRHQQPDHFSGHGAQQSAAAFGFQCPLLASLSRRADPTIFRGETRAGRHLLIFEPCHPAKVSHG